MNHFLEGGWAALTQEATLVWKRTVWSEGIEAVARANSNYTLPHSQPMSLLLPAPSSHE